MKLMSIVLPITFLIACLFLLIFLNRYSISGGDWVTINEWMILLIPSLIGIILGLYYLFNRR